MNIKIFLLKGLWTLLFLLSMLSSLILVFCIIAFLFNLDNKSILQFIVIDTVLSALLWGSFFLITNHDKKKTKEEKKKEIKELLYKMPLILVSSFLTAIYVLIFFFLFIFLTVSEFGKGGWGGDASYFVWLILFLILGISIFGVVMYKVFKTEKQDITLTLYNQFSVLKWSSFVVLPFGLWSAYYFYHKHGAAAWGAMLVWFLVLYLFYKFFSKLAERVQNSITDANVNRIIHEKKKSLINKSHTESNSNIIIQSNLNCVADEIKKLKELLDQGVLTQDEFDIQKNRLIRNK